MDDFERQLKMLLAPPVRAVDRQFVAAMTQRLILEERLRTARRRTWLSLAREAAAAAVVLFVIAMLSSGVGNEDLAAAEFLFSQPTIALIVFALWSAACSRQDASQCA